MSVDVAEVRVAMLFAMFTCGRTAGWCAHAPEQERLSKLVRPAAIGPPDESVLRNSTSQTRLPGR